MWEQLERAELRYRGRRGRGQAAGPRPEPSRPAGTDLLPEIKHIVVLMMENHSYDNYLGMLQGRGDGFPLGADGRPEISNPDTADTVAELARHPSPVGKGDAHGVRHQHPGGRARGRRRRPRRLPGPGR